MTRQKKQIELQKGLLKVVGIDEVDIEFIEFRLEEGNFIENARKAATIEKKRRNRKERKQR